MSESRNDAAVKLTFGNWHLWDRYVISTIRRKNAYVAFDPEPTDPRNPAPATTSATAAATTSTTAATSTTTLAPSADVLKTYREELKEWRVANNVAAGVILGSISDEVDHVIDPKDSAKSMYDKLEAEIVKHSSGSSAYSAQVELVYRQFSEPPTLDNFEKHITFYRSRNADLIAVGAGLSDSFLAFLLLHSFHASEDSVWSIASTNIVTSDTPINQWSFNLISGKLREALRNNIKPAGSSATGTNQAALSASTSKAGSGRYSGPACTHPGCRAPKTHPTDKCWTKEREEKEKANVNEKKKHRAKKAKKKAAESSSDSEAGSESKSEPEPT